MPDAKARQTLDDLAEEILELTNMSTSVRAGSKTGAAVVRLSETEFLALGTLAQESPQTVGAIQKSVGVLPAQMSRIIRALEDKDGDALIRCQINPDDRRRINVSLTAAGRKAHDGYREARLRLTRDLLRELTPADREEFMRLLRLMRKSMAKRLKNR